MDLHHTTLYIIHFLGVCCQGFSENFSDIFKIFSRNLIIFPSDTFFLQTSDLFGILFCCLLGFVFPEFVVVRVPQIVRQILLLDVMIGEGVRVLIPDAVAELL